MRSIADILEEKEVEVYNILKMTFDQWLKLRTGFNESELRAVLNSPERLAVQHYDFERADSVINIYRRKFKREMDCYASQGLDYTYLEWLDVFEQTTPNAFHEMCENTGMTKKEEDFAVWYLRHKYEDFTIGATNPFENN
jgi:hypothetical protein